MNHKQQTVLDDYMIVCFQNKSWIAQGKEKDCEYWAIPVYVLG